MGVKEKSNINPALRKLVVPIKGLKPDPRNVRVHDDRQIEVVMNSLTTYGQVTPIVEHKGIIVKGNATLESAKRLGWTHIAVVPLKLEKKLVDEYKLVDNRTSDLSHFDDSLLLPELNTLIEQGTDAELIGWNDDDIRLIEEGIELEDEPEKLPSDATLLDQLSVTVEEPKTKLERGMVREVGPHTLIVCDPVKDAEIWFPHMKKEFLFAPYPGPYIALSLTGQSKKILMVQPDPFIAGYIVDRYEEIQNKTNGTKENIR